MINAKLYNKPLKLGDLIWYSIKGEGAEEDIGYIHDEFVKKGVKKYKVMWFKQTDDQPFSEETIHTIKEMSDTYIFPVL